MLLCVDGTGTGTGAETIGDRAFHTEFFTRGREANYAVDMMGSFVGMIYYGSRLRNRKYYQGPDWSGTGPNFVRPYELYQRIGEFWRQGDDQIFMTGYSRGAAIVINAAALLNDKRMPMPDGRYATVKAMFLFDSVAKSFELARAHTIPSNVEYCYHAIRDDSANSRWSFGHCGTTMEGPNTFLVPRRFYTTHGGMGGVLWGDKGLPDLAKDIRAEMKHMATPNEQAARARVRLSSCIREGDPGGPTKVTVAQEKIGSDAVHDWMWPFLRKHGVL